MTVLIISDLDSDSVWVINIYFHQNEDVNSDLSFMRDHNMADFIP